MVENIKKCMLTLRRLLRSRPELNSGASHMFWFMMDENMYFSCHPGIMCSHSSDERFLKCAYIIFGFWIYDLNQLQHDETLLGIQTVEDPTEEPPPSEKHYKRTVLSIGGLQMIFRDTSFLRCQADRQTVLLDSDFE